MNKFLGKKGVFYTFLSVAVIMAVALVYFTVRPVAIGYTYSGDFSISILDETQRIDCKYRFLGTNKVEVSIKEIKTGETNVGNCWYVYNDGEFVILGATEDISEEEFKELKQKYLENWDSLYAVYKESVGFTGFPTTINAFSAEIQNGYNYVCLGTILTIAIGGALEVALIVFVALSAKQCFKKTTNKEEQKA